MKQETKQAIKCLSGLHEFEDRGNNYFEILVCKHCEYKGKTRPIMTNEEGKK